MRGWTAIAKALAMTLLTPIAPMAAQEPTSDPEQEAEVVLGARSALGTVATEEERIPVAAGTSLLQYPDLRASVVDVSATDLELPLLERRGDWVAVRYQSLKVWVAVGERPRAASFELQSTPGHERRLRRARSILGADERVSQLGPFTLYTDVHDQQLIDRISAAAADLGRAYGERYGLEAGPRGNEVVVLFRDEEGYRRLEEAEPAIAGLDAHGHATAMMATLSLGGRDSDEVHQLLLHELTHLLNRRTLKRELPPWLEEGLAEDLSYSSLDERGRLDPDTLSGRGSFMGSTRSEHLDTLTVRADWGPNPWGSSPRAALAWLLHNWNRPARPSLESLIELPWAAFVERGRRDFHYAESGFLIRYLLDDRSGLASKLRHLLKEIAAGEEPTAELFWSTLGVPPRRLEDSFHAWLWGQAAAHGVPRPAG